MFPYIDEYGKRRDVRWYDLIYFGSRREDDDTPIAPVDRPLNHFFDPTINDTASWGDNPTPDWALEYRADNTRVGFTGQDYSLADAGDYLYKALTTANAAERKHWQKMYFYSLGHVLHLLADMGQPEHVRLDMHPYYENPDQPYEEAIRSFSIKYETWSLYERYTDEKITAALSRTGSYTMPDFSTARQLWVDEHVGLSNYTNYNFVSEDTNFDDKVYDNPVAEPLPDINTCKDISELYGGKPPNSIHTKKPLSGRLCFVGSKVYDFKPGGTTSSLNPRAASYSIFHREAQEYSQECIDDAESDTHISDLSDCKSYTLNRWNFDAAHDYLLPRIVAYGTALIDHLYRGRLTVLAPSAEQAGKLLIDPGYQVIKQLPLNVANATPDGEAMGAGKLIAVISYVDNDNNTATAIASEEVTGVSPGTSAQPYLFKFPNGGFPLSLKGYTTYLQVIFRGKLGEEFDNVVVARKPLADIIKPIEINTTPPSTGVYALSDHQSTTAGFGTLKVKLAGTESLDGIVVPLITHRINLCYTDDLRGEYNVGGQSRFCNDALYRSEEVFTKQTQPGATWLASSINATGGEFDLSLSEPIPYNATDLMLSLFHFPADPLAPLGIAFADISEPTYISVINNTDQYAINGVYYSIDEMLAGDMKTFVEEANLYATPLNVDIKLNGVSSVTVADLPAGGYARFAVLTQPPQLGATLPFALDATSSNFSASLSVGLSGAQVQLDTATNRIKYSYLPSIRGVISHYPIYLEQPYLGDMAGDLTTLPVIDASQQTPVNIVP